MLVNGYDDRGTVFLCLQVYTIPSLSHDVSCSPEEQLGIQMNVNWPTWGGVNLEGGVSEQYYI